MAVMADFTVVLGDKDETEVGGADSRPFRFDTGGRHAPGNVVLLLMVKGLTRAADGGARVRVNGEHIGWIHNVAEPLHWHTRIIEIGAHVLKQSENELVLESAPGLDGQADVYRVRDVICFFKQDV